MGFTMPEDALSALIIGFVSGVLATLLSWIISHIIFSPRIKVSRDIAFRLTPDKRPVLDEKERPIRDENDEIILEDYRASVYRIKIENASFRNAFDIKIYIRLNYKQQYAIINVPDQPVLLSIPWYARLPLLKKFFPKCDIYQHQKLFPFRMTDIRMQKIQGFKDNPRLIGLFKKRELSLSDFNDEKTTLEVIVTAYDSFSGTAQRTLSQTYTQEEIDKFVIPGYFKDGEMFVTSDEQQPQTSSI